MQFKAGRAKVLEKAKQINHNSTCDKKQKTTERTGEYGGKQKDSIKRDAVTFQRSE